MSTVLYSLANLERHIGDYGAAREHAAAALRVAHRSEFVIGLASGFEVFAFLAAAEGQPFRAAVLAAAVADITARCGAAPDDIPDRAEAEQCLSEVCARLDDASLTRARSLGEAMLVDEAVAYALGPDDRHDAVVDTACELSGNAIVPIVARVRVSLPKTGEATPVANFSTPA